MKRKILIILGIIIILIVVGTIIRNSNKPKYFAYADGSLKIRFDNLPNDASIFLIASLDTAEIDITEKIQDSTGEKLKFTSDITYGQILNNTQEINVDNVAEFEVKLDEKNQFGFSGFSINRKIIRFYRNTIYFKIVCQGEEKNVFLEGAKPTYYEIDGSYTAEEEFDIVYDYVTEKNSYFSNGKEIEEDYFTYGGKKSSEN